MTASREELQALCAEEVMYWHSHSLDYQRYRARLIDLNRTNATLFVFQFQRGEVDVWEKPQSKETARLSTSRLPLYLNFLRIVARRFLIQLELEVGMDLGDCAASDAEIPLLSFQKDVDDRLFLLPDIDFLSFDFYASAELSDNFELATKRDAAIFAGSTTGVDGLTGRPLSHTLETIALLSTERLRAATYFQDHPDVIFRLPSVVQCENSEAEAYLKNLPFCNVAPVSWSEQYGYRYLLSLDGNGATCSRVALALRSQSLLMKYQSRAVLHYFKALSPWTHYVPVDGEAAVESSIRQLRSHPFLAGQIVTSAQYFYNKYLTRPALTRYTAIVLDELSGILGGTGASQERGLGMSWTAQPWLQAHIGGVGDVVNNPGDTVIGVPGSGRPIEAFALSVDHSDLNDGNLRYQGLNVAQQYSNWVRGGMRVGSGGKSIPLTGLRMNCDAHGIHLRYRATFIGGFSSEWIEAPNWCIHVSHAPLESVEVEFIDTTQRRLIGRRESDLHSAL